MDKTTRFIGPRRRLFQWGTSLLLLLIPWFEVDGKSLFRIDIPELSIYLFGLVLRIQELYLVLLATLIFVLGFLFITVVLGRVWCGWCCPQTTLSDLAEWTATHLGLSVKNYRLHGSLTRKIILQGFFLLLALLVAANLLWYFIPPRDFLVRFVSFDLHYATWITFFLIFLLVYLDLAALRRIFCRDFCPYGRIQTSLIDKATLSLHLPVAELERCIECESCVRACPMEIDIREGYQVECTDCGRCLDACRRIMAKRNEPGLIRYTFGIHQEGVRGLLNPRVLLPAIAMSVLIVVLGFSLVDRPVASLRVAVSHTAPTKKLSDGRTATFFNAWVNNRSQSDAAYKLQARNKESGSPLPLKGQVLAELAAGGNRRLDFVLLTPANTSLTVEFQLTDENGQILSIADAYIGKTE